MTILVGSTYKGLSNESPLKGFFRVLQIMESDDLIVLIEVLMAQGKVMVQQKNYYVKGFVRKSISNFIVWKSQRFIEEATIKWPPLWNMTDESIRAEYRQERDSQNPNDSEPR